MDELVAMAEGLEFNAGGVAEATVLSRGLELEAVQDQAAVVSPSAIPVPLHGQGSVVSYTEDTEEGQVGFVTAGT